MPPGTGLRIAARPLLREPAFATVAILTIALGVGANTAIFSIVSGILLRLGLLINFNAALIKDGITRIVNRLEEESLAKSQGRQKNH